MNTLIQHAKLAIRMNNNGINREFIKKFPIEEIIERVGLNWNIYSVGGYCINCGSLFTVGDNYCTNCGTKRI